MYALLLKQNYGIELKKMFLLQVHEEIDGYRMLPVQPMPSLAQAILRKRRKEVRKRGWARGWRLLRACARLIWWYRSTQYQPGGQSLFSADQRALDTAEEEIKTVQMDQGELVKLARQASALKGKGDGLKSGTTVFFELANKLGLGCQAPSNLDSFLGEYNKAISHTLAGAKRKFEEIQRKELESFTAAVNGLDDSPLETTNAQNLEATPKAKPTVSEPAATKAPATKPAAAKPPAAKTSA